MPGGSCSFFFLWSSRLWLVVSDLIMKRRSESIISSKFGIMTELQCFPKPPCRPPRGKEVLERIYCVYKEENQKRLSKTTRKVALELKEFYETMDSGIILLSTYFGYSEENDRVY